VTPDLEAYLTSWDTAPRSVFRRSNHKVSDAKESGNNGLPTATGNPVDYCCNFGAEWAVPKGTPEAEVVAQDGTAIDSNIWADPDVLRDRAIIP
jgi:hypothetical protein